MNKFLTATFVALLSTAAFAQGVIPDNFYVITKDPQNVGTKPTFTATRDGYPLIATNESIQAVINAIRTNEGPLALPYVRIQFGEGGNTLDIIGDSVQFTGDWPGSIYLHGKIMSGNSSPTIKIGQGVSISSEAIIANLGGGYAIHNSGQLSIIGGTVSTANCGGNLGDPNSTCPQTSSPVYHNNEEFPLVLGGSPSIPPVPAAYQGA